jgi:hypothetical protein
MNTEELTLIEPQIETQIIVPFRYGRGKTGNAKTGEERALIVETDFYPNAFEKFRFAVRDSVKNFSNVEESYQKAVKWLLTDGVNQKEAHVQEMQIGKYNLVFVNIQKLQSAPFQYLQSIVINGETINLR